MRPRNPPDDLLVSNRAGFVCTQAVVAPRSERLRRRHPADWLRFVVAAVVTLVTSLLARKDVPSVVEVNLFRLINQLPSTLRTPFLGAMQLGALGAVPVLAAVALLRNRARLARSIVLAGTSAWIVAKLLQALVGRDPPEIVLPGVLLHGAVRAGFAFPSTHVAVAAAMATAAGPYLSRSNRRLAWWGVTVIGVARVYVGAHFPVDVVGGVAVGAAIGSLVELALGAPHGLPDAANVEHALAHQGRLPASTEAVESSSPGVALFRVELDDGLRLTAKVIGRDQPEADWLYRAWRLLAYREVDEAATAASPISRAEHEAYLLMLAGRAGLRVPAVDMTASIGEGEALLVRRWVDGCRLRDLPGDLVTDDVLVELWRELELLHGADIALRSIRLTDIVVDDEGRPWILNLAAGRVGVNADDRARDVADLCALLAVHVGSARAVATAATVFSGKQLRQALSFVQPLALSPSTRRLVTRQRGFLEGLRHELATEVGVDASRVEVPLRIAARNLLPLAGALFAVNLLLPQVGQARASWTALGHASIPWLFVTGAAAAVTYVMAAIALMGAAARPLALGRTWAVQIAAAFTNRLAPAGLGGMATNVRYLEAAGVPRPAAVTAIGLDSVAGFLVHLVAVVLIVPLLGASNTRFHLSGPEIPDQWPLLVGVAGALAATGIVFWGRRIRGRVARSARAAAKSLVDVARRPKAAAALFAGSAGVTAAYALALAASAHAMSINLSLTTIAAIYLGASALAAAAPTPGGLGALEAALVAGLISAGAPTASAVATVLAYRFITYWLPILPGLVAFRVLRRSGTL
ncbi:MAG TPA: lysylphosphatidylglycerol synthase domain-containing protein [Acidimicrobiia bacterium]|nr:lysylphosphatidylglycerol synthase domain-containing protein [Acidimicrobiia bacterium]